MQSAQGTQRKEKPHLGSQETFSRVGSGPAEKRDQERNSVPREQLKQRPGGQKKHKESPYM